MIRKISNKWKCPDELWKELKEILPNYTPNPLGGRPPRDTKEVADGIFYVLKTGIQWKAMPSEFPSGSTCHKHFQQWRRDGVFQKLWAKGLEKYDDLRGIDYRKMNIDTSHSKSPLGGEKNR